MAFPIILYFYFFIFPSLSFSSDPPMCDSHDYFALLQFNNSLSLHPSASVWCDAYLDDSYTVQFKNLPFPKTTTWRNDSNCCLWDGVTCDSLSGHVIGLDLSCSWLHGQLHPNSSLFQLFHLRTLNLAFNDFSGSFISSQFGDLSSLTHLNLSYSSFTGEIPSKIAQLSKLASLDLSWNRFDLFESSWSPLRLEPSTWKKIIQNMTNLRELVLDHVNMSSITPSSLSLLMNLSSSLVSLKLQDTELRGDITNNILCLQNLQQLDLSSNEYLNGRLPKSEWSSSLTLLDLSYTGFTGEVPNSLGHLKCLNHLNLANCGFEGPVPLSFRNLTQLTYLDLHSNKFSGEISFLSNTEHLIELDFSENYSSSHQSHNHLVQPIYSLRYCDLSYNKFEGEFPKSIFGHTNLSFLSLSSNNMSDLVDFYQFSSFQKLQQLDLSNNKFLSFNFNEYVDYTIANLQHLDLSSCNINTLPKLSGKLQSLVFLKLSNNKIHGKVPEWFNNAGNDYLLNLDLSHNFFTSIEHLALRNISNLNVSYNMLQGKIPERLNNVGNGYVDLSHNNFTSIECLSEINVDYLDLSFNMLQGNIPTSLCKANSLQILNLSRNNLSGLIPQCLIALPNLLVLDLQKNNLAGNMPCNFSKSNVLQTLHLNSNRLGGPIPRSLSYCNQLQILDVGENKIEDSFPNWLEGLPELQVLVLRDNKLHGTISSTKMEHPFPKLRIFDISSNHFRGPLPTSYIKEFKGMMKIDNVANGSLYMENTHDQLYQDSVMITMKGNSIELKKILKIFSTLDLSNNRFDGEIPEVIGELYSLKGLNLSHNRITGSIPQSMGNLMSLEWFDLSCNKLMGEIPLALTNLNFLEILNLSQNHLQGIIPRGKQFDTFPNDSYEGNLGLCGPPLAKSCSKNDGKLPQPSASTIDHDGGFNFGWKPVALGYGCGMVFGMLIGYIVFSTGKPQWLVRIYLRIR